VLGDVLDYDGVFGWLLGGLEVEHIILRNATIMKGQDAN